MGVYRHFMATGRVAMYNPNLLGIDKDGEIEVDGQKHFLSLRKAFRAKSGYTLITADYCQIELRILAALAQEETLIKIFKLGKDPFRLIAARIYKKQPDDILEFERNSAKQVGYWFGNLFWYWCWSFANPPDSNHLRSLRLSLPLQIIYSIIYGVGTTSLTKNLGFSSEEETIAFKNEFSDVFPKLMEFVEKRKEDARKDGYITTLFARRRYLSNINSEQSKARAHDERKAVNSSIQGSASDLVKHTMLRIDRAVQRERIECDLLLQIHDELIFQVKDEHVEQFISLIVDIMRKSGEILKTVLNVKVKKGPSWSECVEVPIPTAD